MKRLISLALIFALLLAGVGVSVAQQYQGGQQYQGSTQQGGERTLNIPPAPPKSEPNMEYGNTARAAAIGERLSNAAEGNARVYIKEDGAVTVNIYLLQEADPYDLAGTMANFTYMIADLYGTITEKTNSDILLKVYNTSNSLIIDAKFSIPKNAFAYFKVSDAPKPRQPSQSATMN
jgi:hypothetical protein